MISERLRRTTAIAALIGALLGGSVAYTVNELRADGTVVYTELGASIADEIAARR